MINDLIRRLKQLQIVHQGPVELKNAGASQYYIDIKTAYGDAEAFQLLVKSLGVIIPNQATCIAGAGYGGLPLAAALSIMFDRNLVLVRDALKYHGIIKPIGGYNPTADDKVAIVDDVFTTGESLRNIIQTLEPTGADILGCYVVVKRGEGRLNVPVEHLINVEDLLSESS